MSAPRRRTRSKRTGDETKSARVEAPPRKRLVAISRRLELAGALAVTLVIGLLHVYRAAHAGALWRDELSTLRAAILPSFSGVWSSLIYEPFPLMTYTLVRAWACLWLGDLDTGLRVLGALIGVGVL